MDIRQTVNHLKAIRRERAIRDQKMSGYRMVGRTIPPKKGKGATYKRPRNGQYE